MNDIDQRDNLDTTVEPLVRGALAEHAASPAVDTDAAWAAMAPRLAFTQTPIVATSTKTTTATATSAPVASRRATAAPRAQRWRFALVGVVAALVAGVMLTAAGYFGWAGPFSFGPFSNHEIRQIGENHLYTRIGQTQESVGVALTLDSAYTDAGNTYIAYHVLPTSGATSSYNGFIPDGYSLTDQYGEEPNTGSLTECDAYQSGQPQYCLLNDGPFHPPTGATQLTISLSIPELLLTKGGANGGSVMLHGSWQFSFTLPFHQKSLGATNPGAQPSKQP
ncbi:MAG: DUF4179 domain-containing protein [Ktedonobacterales bacterium]